MNETRFPAMTQVTFHVNAPDKTAYACRLLRKAAGMGAKVMVTGRSEELGRLDVALWTFSALEFLSHCRSDAPAPMVAVSSVVLADAGQPVRGARVLLHLGGPSTEDVQTFDKVIEIVGQDPADRQEARQRWRLYAGQGHEMVHHEVTQ